jgi:hypothetical protein
MLCQHKPRLYSNELAVFKSTHIMKLLYCQALLVSPSCLYRPQAGSFRTSWPGGSCYEGPRLATAGFHDFASIASSGITLVYRHAHHASHATGACGPDHHAAYGMCGGPQKVVWQPYAVPHADSGDKGCVRIGSCPLVCSGQRSRERRGAGSISRHIEHYQHSDEWRGYHGRRATEPISELSHGETL